MPMHYKRTGWLSPKSEDAHVLEQLRTFSSQWLEPNYDISEQPPHARDEDPKASFLGPPKQQCPDLMLTRAQWGQVKHKRPVSVICRTPLFSLKRQHTHIGRDLRQFIAGRLVPGMHHGCKGNISPTVPHTKPFVSTHKRTQTPKTPECRFFHSKTSSHKLLLHSYFIFQYFLPNKRWVLNTKKPPACIKN